MNALVVVDVQNDFCEGGALEVPNGDEVVEPINSLMRDYNCVAFTQDWHPENHRSFASVHDGSGFTEEHDPFETVEFTYGKQTLWPDHCVQGTEGAEFHPDLDTSQAEMIIRKGFRPRIDSYSAFYENDGKTATGLSAYLKERGVHSIYVVGLATDFCVKWTALDGFKEGFHVHVIEDATRGIYQEQTPEKVKKEIKNEGVKVIKSNY